LNAGGDDTHASQHQFDSPSVNIGFLANVEAGEVETEGLHAPNEILDPSTRWAAASVALEAGLNQEEVFQEFMRSPVFSTTLRRLEHASEPFSDDGQFLPVGLSRIPARSFREIRKASEVIVAVAHFIDGGRPEDPHFVCLPDRGFLVDPLGDPLPLRRAKGSERPTARPRRRRCGGGARWSVAAPPLGEM